jgi:hypothetical protein
MKVGLFTREMRRGGIAKAPCSGRPQRVVETPLTGGAGLAAMLSSDRRASAGCSAERQPQAAALSQELFDGQVFPCTKDWLEFCSCHCTADRLHAGVDFETPDGRNAKAVTDGFALNVKIGLGR